MPIIFASFAIAPYAAILGLVYAMLSMHVANFRRRDRVAHGAVNHERLERGVRAHGNFIEYVPFALLLIWLMGATGSGALWIHIMGIILVLGRLSHAYGILIAEPQRQNYYFRAFGMLCTIGVIVAASIVLLLHWIGYAATT